MANCPSTMMTMMGMTKTRYSNYSAYYGCKKYIIVCLFKGGAEKLERKTAGHPRGYDDRPKFCRLHSIVLREHQKVYYYLMLNNLYSLLNDVLNSTFNFTVPFLSYLAILLLVIGSFVLYAIPLRYLIIAWGINKFTRKILRPHSIPNNELLDFLSRVPNDEQLVSMKIPIRIRQLLTYKTLLLPFTSI